MKRSNLLDGLVSFFSRAQVPAAAGAIDLSIFEEVGIVTETIHPYQPGRVEYRASWWEAVCLNNVVLLPGTQVQIVDRDNITLVVKPIAPVQVATLVRSIPDAA